MFKNSQKINISRHILIPLVFIVLMLASLGVSCEGAYAADLNQTSDVVKSELNVEDKFINSQENSISPDDEQNDVLALSQENEVLGDTYKLNGGTFSDIKEKVKNAKSGDTIKLSGTFKAEGAYDTILLNKKLHFTSDSQATLDAKGLTFIFNVNSSAAGSTFKNIKFVNGYRDTIGAALYIRTSDIVVSNCVFEKNSARDGGAIYTSYNNHSAKNLIVENCKFYNNHALKSAAALAAFGNNSLIKNCIFEGNTVKNNEHIVGFGGAIQVSLPDEVSCVTVDGCIFKNNKVDSNEESSHGGAGCVRDGSTYKNCVFINNSAFVGGALTLHGSGVIENCTFTENTAFSKGGAIYSGGVNQVVIHNCSLKDNDAVYGGGAYLAGEKVEIYGCDFDLNRASQNGGAVFVNASTVNVHDVQFTKNTANVDGGAIYIHGTNTTVKDSSFISNKAIPDAGKLDDGLGGAIYINSTQANIEGNDFRYNTARNGSAVYYDKNGKNLKMTSNTMYQNQAWVYLLPIYAHNIYYGDVEKIKSIIHGGNNIARFNDLAVSNAVYNAAKSEYITIDGEKPQSGATTNGKLYQDDREYNMNVMLTVAHEDGTVVYNKTLNSDTFGQVDADLKNLKAGKYYVTAVHSEDTYYKAIKNTTTFTVTPKIDSKVKKTVSSNSINYNDIVVWTLNISNNGPSNSTGVIVRDVLPEGLIWLEDDTNGKYNPKTGVLTIGFLQVGQVITVNIKTMVNKTGNIVNKANITANEYDYNMTNNRDQADVNVNPSSDLAVKKSANQTRLNYHDLVKWTVTVSNNGPDTVHDVVVEDILPSSLIFVSASGNYNKNTGKWTIPSLAKNQKVSFDIITMVNATGSVKNSVSVSGREYDVDKSNNFDDEVVGVTPASDLAIIKTVNASSVNLGDVVRWTLTVVNNGPNPATGVKVSDVLPAGFVYLSSTKAYNNGVIDFGSLAVGARASVDILSKVNATGSFVNVASVKGNEYDWDLSNNRDDASLKVNPASDLSVVKSVDNPKPNFNDTVKWTLTVSNNGPDTAHDVVVEDILPSSLIFVSADGNYNKNTGKWNIATLNVGETVKLTVLSRINASGSIKNSVSVSGREYDVDKSNNFDDEVVGVAPASDLAIIKTVNASNVNFGDVVRWTLTVVNNGPNPATGVKVSDVLPTGFVYLSSTKAYNNGVIDFGSLAVGARASADILSKVNATGSFVNVASVKGNEYDWDLSNNRDDASLKVNPASDLSVVKSVDNPKPNFNDTVKWTLTVSNNGPDTAHDVVVKDILSKELIWISDSSLGKYNSKNGIWNVGTLAKNQKASIDIITRVNATGVFTNNVSVSGREYDYNRHNNFDDEKINVSKASDLSVIKIVNSSTVNYLQFVKWTVIAHNNGPDNATGVYVDEILPDGLMLINYTATKGFYDNNIWTVCCMEPGTTQTLELICKVNKTGTITNIVEITGNEYDPDLSNNKNNKSVTVPLSSDLQVIKNVNNSNPNFADIIEWSLTVTNNGPDDSADVMVIESLPKGLRFIDYESTAGTFANDIWDVGYLRNGASEYLLIRCQVETLDDVENTAKAIPSQYDWNSSNNNDSEFISVNPVADLSITKLIDKSDANYLDLVRWTLIVNNNGPNDATGVFVSDVIPHGLQVVYVEGEGQYENGIWEIGRLSNGQSATLDIVCKIKATGDFTNVAYVWADEFDPDLDNNEDENYLHVPPASDLSITKTVSKYKYSVGDLISYSIKITNKGPDRAENVKVREIMDDGLLLKSAHASGGDFDDETGVWSLDSLDAGQSAYLTVSAIAKHAGAVKNKVSATSDNYDPDLTNNNDTVEVSVSHKVVPKKADIAKKASGTEFGEFSDSVLLKYKSGNPVMVIVLLLVFTMGALYGNNILKKR